MAGMGQRRQGQEGDEEPSGRGVEGKVRYEGPGAILKGDGPGEARGGAGLHESCAFSTIKGMEHHDAERPGPIPCEGLGARSSAETSGSGTTMMTGSHLDATTTASGGGSMDDGCAGQGVPSAPQSYEGWLSFLAQAGSLRQLGISLAWGCKAGHSLLRWESAGPKHPSVSGSHSGGMFPLPVIWPEDFSRVWADRYTAHCTDFAAKCWLGCACVALNVYYGSGRDGSGRKPGKVHRRALEVLEDKIKRFLKGETLGTVSFLQVVEDLKLKRVSYTGEETSQPLPLSAEQIEKALPPVGHGGCIAATDFLVGRTRFLLENPQENLLPLRERGVGPMQAKVHIKKGEELPVFKLLESRGVTTWIPIEKVYSDSQGECLNGLFGVTKPGKFSQSGSPVLRVIMNLIPANRLLQVILGDVHLLPHGAGWIPLVVQAGEELRISQGDMSAAFYLFRIPEEWQRYMSFAFKVKGEDIGLSPGSWFRPCCRVLPMGWNSSVGIMQMISRQLLLSRGLPPSLELHRGRAVPTWFTKVVEATTEDTAWWQIYLDNFMSAERTSGQYHEVDVSLQTRAMEAWHTTGVLTADDKQVLGTTEAVELGIRLDGVEGLLGSSPERILKTCFATVHLLLKETVSKKDIQVVLGRWVFVLQFRRAAMGVLSRSWEAVEGPWTDRVKRRALCKELQMLLCLAPLLQTDLRCEYDETVSCSDASESGGAAALSMGLSWSGRSLVRAVRDPSRSAIPCPILVVSAFNGVGGAFRIYDILGVRVLGKIAIEIAKDANRTTRCAWPDVEEFHNIEDVDQAQVRRWANQFPRVLEVHLWGGFPCVHLSRVRAYRRNLDGEGSKLFWHLVDLIGWFQDAFAGHARVKFCVENVASMDESACQEISRTLEVQPVKLDPADTLPFNRPRLAWCSEEIFAMEELSLWLEGDYVRAKVTAGTIEDSQWMRPGWRWLVPDRSGVKLPTFMKSIVRQKPPPFPAGLNKAGPAAIQRWQDSSYRFPPYQYQDQYLVTHPDHGHRLVDASERELLLGLGAGHTATCRSASEAKSNWAAYEDSRLSLCGDSFAISSFAIVGAAMCAAFVPRMKPSDIIGRMGLAPGASAHPSISVPLTRWLAYGGGNDEGGEEAAQLVRYLGRQVNHTGSDVRILSGEPMGKKGSHGSMRAWWWQWKHLFSVKWINPHHINFLEMKMILLTLLWKGRNPDNCNKRWFHLEDSMVCLYILSKGRTSSHLLQPLVNKIGAVQLFLGCTVLHGHVGSLENPTDAASRK